MNGSTSSNKNDVSLSPNAVLPEFAKKPRSKESLLLTKCVRDVFEFAKEDTKRVAFALKAGLAMLVVSLLILIQRPFEVFGTNSLWSILTVGIMFEYSVGATLYRGFNRAVGSLLAGIFAFSVIGIAMSSGHLAEPYVIGLSIFLVGASTSFMKQWPSLVPYEYGFRVILFTYCLLIVSTYCLSNPIKTAMNRLYSIAIGAAVAVGVNVLVFPTWAGEQLHDELVDGFYSVAESLEECVKKYLSDDGLDHTTKLCKTVFDEFPNDPAYQKCRAILNSSARIDSLANSAKWEPPHGRFRHYYNAWSEYVKAGALLRHCAYEVMALYGCLSSEIQAPYNLRITFQKEILEVTVEAAELLRNLASDVNSMKKQRLQVCQLKRVHVATDRLQRSIDLHSYLLTSALQDCTSDESDLAKKLKVDAEEAPIAAQLQAQSSYHETVTMRKQQQRRLYSWPSREVDDLEEDGGDHNAGLMTRMRALESTAALSLATFALLLIEFVARLDHLVDGVDELAAAAKFKQETSSSL